MAFIKFPVELFDLNDAEKIALMLRIIMRMDAQGNGVCFETRTSMCKHLKINRKAWSRKISELQESGFILVERRNKAPNQITLTEHVKALLWGQNDPVTRSNINIDWGSKRPRKEDHMESENPEKKKKKVVRRRRPTNKIQSDPPLSELDAIHRKFLSKSVKTRKSDTEDSGS